MLRLNGEVNHHDGVFLHDAHEHDEADKPVDVQVNVKQHQREQRAKARRRQAGQNRQRMDEAFVENSQDDVNHQNGHDQQKSQPGQRRLKHRRRALEARADGRGQVQFALQFVDFIHRRAERDAGRKVERHGDGGQLADVRNGHRRDAARQFRHGAQRHEPGLVVRVGERAGDVEPAERVGVLLEFRQHLEHDPVFREVAVNRRNLAGAERVVKAGLNLLRRHAQRGGLVAVNGHDDLRAGDLQIARHILKDVLLLRNFPHEHRRVGKKLLRVGVLQAELIRGFGQHAAHTDERRNLGKDAEAGNLRKLLAQILDDFAGALPALRTLLQPHEDAAVVAADGRAAEADRRHERGDVGVGRDNFRRLLLVRLHRLERNVLRALGDAENLVGVLIREKALGNQVEQKPRGHERHQRHAQRDAAAPHRHAQGALVKRTDALEKSFKRVVKPAVRLPAHRMHEPAAHHRRERKRHKSRNQHGADDGHGKLVQQPPQQAAHEQHRDEHRRERQRHRDDGEADFLRAAQGGGHRRLAVFHVPHDVFQHHNGVVHHEADGQGERHQGKVVEAEAGDFHRRERADNGQRQREAGNDRRGNISQENENHHHHQAHRQHQGSFHVADGQADALGTVKEFVNIDRRGNLRAQHGQLPFDRVHDGHGVHAGLALHGEDDAARALEPRGDLVVLHAVNDMGDLL